ncbi:MAG TPA: toll/interleukin-1 receptor domain-containing protein [Pyrinomonadaceae bacterium]|nr:toll/interleukin-1 receptor domain-containing protein [Pyrinomonadaceae bacterium]
MTTQIFISYRREDTADITGRIYDRLTYKYGTPAVFKDVDSIPPGIDFRTYLDSKIKECSVVLVVIGDNWLKEDPKTGAPRLTNPDDYVRIEIESALKRKIPVIPLLVEGASRPPQESLPEKMKDLVYRQERVIGRDPDFRLHMDALIADLERIFDESHAHAQRQRAQVRPTPPVRPAFRRPANSAPLPPPPASTVPTPPRAPVARPPQQTSGAGKWILLTIVLTAVFVGFIIFLSVLIGMADSGMNY